MSAYQLSNWNGFTLDTFSLPVKLYESVELVNSSKKNLSPQMIVIKIRKRKKEIALPHALHSGICHQP